MKEKIPSFLPREEVHFYDQKRSLDALALAQWQREQYNILIDPDEQEELDAQRTREVQRVLKVAKHLFKEPFHSIFLAHSFHGKSFLEIHEETGVLYHRVIHAVRACVRLLKVYFKREEALRKKQEDNPDVRYCSFCLTTDGYATHRKDRNPNKLYERWYTDASGNTICLKCYSRSKRKPPKTNTSSYFNRITLTPPKEK